MFYENHCWIHSQNKACLVLSERFLRLTCVHFLVPAGKGALLRLIHYLAHYCPNRLIKAALLTTFSCRSLLRPPAERVLLPWLPQTHNKVSGVSLAGGEAYYEKHWHSSLSLDATYCTVPPHDMKQGRVLCCSLTGFSCGCGQISF